MKWCVDSNIGVVREENQDHVAVLENNYILLAILCDGMGGHFGGSLASSITIETFRQRMNQINSAQDNVYDWFKESIKLSKQNMVNEAGNDENKKDMGTTVTAAVVFKDTKEIVVFNIGDSRTYVFDGLLHQITVDHNLMNYFIINEKMSEFEAAKLPGAAALTSALGPNKKTNIEAFTIEPDRDNKPRTLILTSDGIHDYITKPRFETIMNSHGSIESKAETLIKEGIKGGSSDNLSVIVVEVL